MENKVLANTVVNVFEEENTRIAECA